MNALLKTEESPRISEKDQVYRRMRDLVEMIKRKGENKNIKKGDIHDGHILIKDTESACQVKVEDSEGEPTDVRVYLGGTTTWKTEDGNDVEITDVVSIGRESRVLVGFTEEGDAHYQMWRNTREKTYGPTGFHKELVEGASDVGRKTETAYSLDEETAANVRQLLSKAILERTPRDVEGMGGML